MYKVTAKLSEVTTYHNNLREAIEYLHRNGYTSINRNNWKVYGPAKVVRVKAEG